jgi:hypothetical protein
VLYQLSYLGIAAARGKAAYRGGSASLSSPPSASAPALGPGMR